MVAALDLKALTDETIAQMGYNSHDLWLVRLGSVVFGPYETESLKHYLIDNEHLFENAFASRMDNNEMKPFWSYNVFQKRTHPSENQKENFWIMHTGIKVGPITYQEIDKKITSGHLAMTDHVSTDDGHHWKKTFEIPGLDRRPHSPNNLPKLPGDDSFYKAKLRLVEKMEQIHSNISEDLASLTHLGQQQAKVIQFKVEELTMKAERRTEVSQGAKWIMPAAMVVLTVITSGYYFISTEDGNQIPQVGVAAVTEAAPTPATTSRRPKPRGEMPIAQRRLPASSGYSRPDPRSFGRESNIPTHIETHEEFRNDSPEEPVPQESPVAENEAPVQEEHSLVNTEPAEKEPQDTSLDAAMNGVEQPVEQQPIVEEASDF
jgi:hypothetical protein